MGMIADPVAQRQALQLAAMKPIDGFDPGFFARFKSDWDEAVGFHNSEAEYAAKLDVAKDFINQFRQASGQELPNWVPEVSALPFGGSQASREQQARQQFDTWKEQHPESDLVFPDADTIQKEADARVLNARQQQQRAAANSTGIASAVGGFLGSAAGSMTDPVNIAMMAAGGGVAGGILKTALVEGALGASSEAIVQALTYADKKRVDPSYTVGEAADQVLEAGAGAALFGAGAKTLAAAWSRIRTGEWPSPIRDAANVVTREASVPDSHFGPSVASEAAHKSAVEAAADDVIRGQPVEIPQEAFLLSQARPGRIYDADGRSVGVQYELADADSLVTSHDLDLNPNPDFPPELQPRDRSRQLSKDQISSIANNLQPERLGPSPQADSGAPIVGPDNLVESGNGRVLALKRAFEDDGIPAANYRRFLQSQGLDPEGMNKPVLIARRITDLSPEDRVGFVSAANRATAMRLGAGEQALADARLIDNGLMDRLHGDEKFAAGNRGFVAGFMSRLPRAEQGELIDRNGALSQAGERRITAALMGRAYDEPAFLSRALEDADSNIKSLAGAMADAAVPWVRMRDAVATGAVPRGMDITPDLLQAMRMVMKSRDEGIALPDLVNQAEMFGGPSEISKILARSMFNEDMTRAVGRTRVANFLAEYANEARKNEATDYLFGEPLQNADILKTALDRVGRQDLRTAAEENLTPEAVEELRTSPEAQDAVIADAERMTVREAGEPMVTVDLGDGAGEVPLESVFTEADAEIAAAKDIEACATGRAAAE